MCRVIFLMFSLLLAEYQFLVELVTYADSILLDFKRARLKYNVIKNINSSQLLTLY